MATTKPPYSRAAPSSSRSSPTAASASPCVHLRDRCPLVAYRPAFLPAPTYSGPDILFSSRVRSRKQSRLTLVFCAPSLSLRHSLRKGADALLEKLGEGKPRKHQGHQHAQQATDGHELLLSLRA